MEDSTRETRPVGRSMEIREITPRNLKHVSDQVPGRGRRVSIHTCCTSRTPTREPHQTRETESKPRKQQRTYRRQGVQIVMSKKGRRSNNQYLPGYLLIVAWNDLPIRVQHYSLLPQHRGGRAGAKIDGCTGGEERGDFSRKNIIE